MRWYLFIISLILVMGLVSSVEENEYQIFKVNKASQYWFNCYNDAQIPCPAAMNCTASVQTPLGRTLTPIVINNGNYFYLNLSSNDNSEIGTYQGIITCDSLPSLFSGQIAVSYNVNATGGSGQLWMFVILTALVYIIGFFGFFGKNEWLSIMGGMGMIMLGLFFINNGVDTYRNFMTDAIAWTTIGVGALFSLTAAVALVNDNL